MDYKSKIMQWNCRGPKPNYNEILMLLTLMKPSVFLSSRNLLKTLRQYII